MACETNYGVGSTREYFAAAAAEILLRHSRRDSPCYLPTAVTGGLNRVREVPVFITDDAKIKNGNAVFDGFSDDAIVDDRECGE